MLNLKLHNYGALECSMTSMHAGVTMAVGIHQTFFHQPLFSDKAIRQTLFLPNIPLYGIWLVWCTHVWQALVNL